MRLMISLFWAALVVAASAGCVVAQAGPPAVVVVFDGSGSMWGKLPGSAKPKFELAGDALRASLGRIPPGTQSGMVGFGAGPRGCAQAGYLSDPAAHDTERILAAIDTWNPRGKGPLAAALRTAAQPFADQKRSASLIVVHDGNDNCGADVCAAAKELKLANPGLRIHLVSLGLSPEDAGASKCIAALTGGGVFAANRGDDVSKAVEQAVTAASLVVAPRPAIGTPAGDQGRDGHENLPGLDGPGLRVTLSLGQTDKPIGVPLTWHLHVHRQAGSEVRRVPIVMRRAPQLLQRLPAGTYSVEGLSGGLRVGETFKLAKGESKHIKLKLDAGVLDVSAAIGGKLALSDGGRIVIHPAGRSGKEHVELGPGGGTVLLEAGSYRVLARDGALSSELAVDVSSGARSRVQLDLGGGRLSINVTQGPDAEAVGPVRVLLLEDTPETRGRREIGRTSSPVSDWSLGAGTYYANVTVNGATTNQRIVVPPGILTRADISVPSRRIRFAVAGDARIADDSAYGWTIEPIGHDDASPILRSGASIEVVLGHGRYRVASSIGEQNAVAQRQILVSPSSAPSTTFTHQAGVVSLRVKADNRAVVPYWVVEDQSGARVWAGAQAAPEIYLNAGAYQVSTWIGGRTLKRNLTVSPGSRSTVVMDGQ
ncbi:MAG: hypothetical protein RLZ98_1704 [Pseudomonadota bacterium]|jgi:Ca-activated chloride channel family protein